MTLAVRHTAARTQDTAPAQSAPPGTAEVEPAPASVGICGTDLHVLHSGMDARVRTPAVPGHEMSGRVVRVGPGVEDWSPGVAVTTGATEFLTSDPAADVHGTVPPVGGGWLGR